jgi:enoyl-CoA hydratase/carnithine racemase
VSRLPADGQPTKDVEATEEVVLYQQIADHVVLVTLNRPEKRNAVNAAVARGLDAAVKRSEVDPNIRVVILTSSHPSVFCAGADLAEVAAGDARTRCYTPDGGFAGFVDQVRRKPWIAAAQGSIVAGGLEIALACELRVVARASQLGLPEVKRGLIAGAGGLTRLPKAVPIAVALEMVATGRPIDAERAYQVGLVNRVVPADQLMDSAIELAEEIATGAPLAVYSALELAKAAPQISEAEGRRMTEVALDRVRATNDFREGPQAFLEKRPPEWTGT